MSSLGNPCLRSTYKMASEGGRRSSPSRQRQYAVFSASCGAPDSRIQKLNDYSVIGRIGRAVSTSRLWWSNRGHLSPPKRTATPARSFWARKINRFKNRTGLCVLWIHVGALQDIGKFLPIYPEGNFPVFRKVAQNLRKVPDVLST